MERRDDVPVRIEDDDAVYPRHGEDEDVNVSVAESCKRET